MNTIPQPVVIAINLLILIWVFSWKGLALWSSAKHNQKKWFIFLLIATLPPLLLFPVGLIDIVYLFFFAKKKMTLREVIKDVKNIFRPKKPSK